MIDIVFIVLAVMFGTLLYDKQKRPRFMIKENFTPQEYQPIDYDNNIASVYGYKQQGYDTTPQNIVKTCTDQEGLLGVNRWCPSAQMSSTGTSETSTRRLIGGVNPRTMIAPIIPAPITDITEWGTDNYKIHSATNNHRSYDLFLSGFESVNGNCMCQGMCQCPTPTSQTRENFDTNFVSPYDVVEQRMSRPQILQNYGIDTVPEKSLYTSITDGNELRFIETQRSRRPEMSVDYISGDDPSMIYDPRSVGYSDPKRSYIDKNGQIKFYYDDINAAKAPNYITRNKIDIYSFGEKTGRLRDPKTLCGNTNQLAVEEFHKSALLHRADLMQSLMSKRNGEMWQLRQFPISTNGQRMPGGTSKI